MLFSKTHSGVLNGRVLTTLATAALLVSCSSTAASPGATGATTSAGAGNAGGAGNSGGSGNDSGAGGRVSTGTGMAGAAASGTIGDAAGTSGVNPSGGGRGGSPPGAGGSAPGGSGGATGGNANPTGGSGGASGGGGAGGTPTSFTCNQVTGMTLTRQWFEAGFEMDPGVSNAGWQLKAREHGYITEWADANSDFWNEPLESPCAAGSTNPDHVVLTVLSWNPACCTKQAEWETQIDAAVANLRAKYSALKRIDLMTVIRGPGNMLCPTAPAANETIAMPAELDAALAAVAAKSPGVVFVTPKFEAPSCDSFEGGGPHLVTAGNTAVAKDIAAYFGSLR